MQNSTEPSDKIPANEISEIDVAEFTAVIDHFKQDLREFFSRSHFYLVVQGFLLSAFFARAVPASTFEYFSSYAVIFAGLTLAVFWHLVVKGAVLWIKRWRIEVRELSRKYSNLHSYDRIEERSGEIAEHHSAEEITALLPKIFIGFWLLTLIALGMESFAGTPLPCPPLPNEQ